MTGLIQPALQAAAIVSNEVNCIMSIRIFSYILLIVTALLEVVAQALTGQNLLEYLNLFPLILYFIVFEIIIKAGGGKWHLLSPVRRARAFGLVVGVILPLLTSHLSWLLNFEGIFNNRFEDPLAFVFVPFLALVSGIVGYVAGGIIGLYKKN